MKVHASTTVEQREDGVPLRRLLVSGEVAFDSEGYGDARDVLITDEDGEPVALSQRWEDICTEHLIEVAATLTKWRAEMERGAA